MVAFEVQEQRQQAPQQQDQAKALLGLQQEQQPCLLMRAFEPLQKPHLIYVEHVHADLYLHRFASFF